MSYYGKHIKREGTFGLQKSELPLIYSDTFIQITEQEYNQLLKEKQEQRAARRQSKEKIKE